jgi:hypothetical protein
MSNDKSKGKKRWFEKSYGWERRLMRMAAISMNVPAGSSLFRLFLFRTADSSKSILIQSNTWVFPGMITQMHSES